MNPADLTLALKEYARRLGFDLAGACPAVQPLGWQRFRAWLEAGFAGQMQYLHRHAEARRHPRHVLPGARSALVLAVNYRTVEPVPPGVGQASVSRYAWGTDYHLVLRGQLRRLVELHRQLAPDERARAVVDTAPLLEREYAQMAGLGWIGKNTMLINRQFGSWLFLAVLLTTAELSYDAPTATEHCKGCRRCLEACPTGAIVEPYRLDARRCLSYLSMEFSGALADEFRAVNGRRLFGCDACQEVCPHNRQTPCTINRHFRPRAGMNPVDLGVLAGLSAAEFDSCFGDTPLSRAGHNRLHRNATACP